MKPEMIKIHRDDIIVDEDIQIRAGGIDPEFVDRYVDGYTGSFPGQMPPPWVFRTPQGLMLADGFHRLAALDKVKKCADYILTVWCQDGSRDDAIIYATTANTRHGRPLSREDRQQAIRRLLRMTDWSYRKIGDALHLAHTTVMRIDERENIRLSGAFAPDRITVTRNGTAYQMNAGGINADRTGDEPPTEQQPVIGAQPEISEAIDLLPPYIPHMDTTAKWGDTLQPSIEGSAAADQDQDDTQPTGEQQTRRPMTVHHSSDSPEHYTPAAVIEAVQALLGTIDLDPCSNSHTAPNVPAGRHYTVDDDGLDHVWEGTVYMNPPYGRGIDAWVKKLVSAYESGYVTQAIALVPARTDTQWWQVIRNYPCCFVTGRLTFIGNDDPAPFPSAVFYLGERMQDFYDGFSSFGDIWTRIDENWFTE